MERGHWKDREAGLKLDFHITMDNWKSTLDSVGFVLLLYFVFKEFFRENKCPLAILDNLSVE